jgi:ornithine cyclodeaminase/alanine dehydrogenase-like protein (mu-crystallin family)
VERAAAESVRLLTRSEVRGLLRWPELIEAAERALVAMATSDVAAESAQLRIPGAALHLKSGSLPAHVLSVKANLRPDAGSSAGVVLAFDPVLFTLRAILDSADITAMRTAAIAAVAARRLTRPGNQSVAVLGLGPVGRHSLTALSQVLEVSAVRLWSRKRDHAEEVAATVPGTVSVHESAARAAAGATVVLTATPSRDPLLTATDLGTSAVVLAMGADSPGKRELGEGVLAGATVLADVLADALSVGECAYLPPGADQAACMQLGDVLAGRRDLEATGGRIIFDSVGSAVVDAAATGLILGLAESNNVGVLTRLDA